MARIFLIAVLLLGCSRDRAKESAPAQSPPAAAKPPNRVIILAFAAFNDDNLAECGEIFVRPKGTLTPDAGAAVTTFGDKIWEAMNKPQKGVVVTRLSRKCGEQFADRQPFGWCHDEKFTGSKDLLMDHFHYSFAAVFKSDGMMRECMEQGGEWGSISRDSPEYIQAKLSHDTDTAQRNYDDARKDIDRAMRSLR